MSKPLRLPATLAATAILCTVVVLTALSASLAQAERSGFNEITGHAGDREAKPDGWKEAEWENSVQAVERAFSIDPDFGSNGDNLFGPRWVEIDVQLNQSAEAKALDPNGVGILYVTQVAPYPASQYPPDPKAA